MSTFRRRFDYESHAGWHTIPAIRELFARWALPGTESGEDGLRIGIRAGYLNLYAKGQSVAKLSFAANGPRIEVHDTYRKGIRRGDGRLHRLGMSKPIAACEIEPAEISKWIGTAITYATTEKRYVDDLIAANPGVIDLEMGLPAGKGERTAPRMDLVVAQGSEIAFWEAKCSNNKELRSKSSYQEDPTTGEYRSGIHVIHQLRKYQRWMDASARRLQVAQAYWTTAGLLMELADLFERPGQEARDAWRGLRGGEVRVILPPAVAVGGYRPYPETTVTAQKGDELADLTKSFGPFRAIIESYGAKVVCHSANTPRRLPILMPGVISDRPTKEGQ